MVRLPLNTLMPFIAAVLCAAAIGMAVGFVLYRLYSVASSFKISTMRVRSAALSSTTTSLVWEACDHAQLFECRVIGVGDEIYEVFLDWLFAAAAIDLSNLP